MYIKIKQKNAKQNGYDKQKGISLKRVNTKQAGAK
jgi:hypothetical protein